MVVSGLMNANGLDFNLYKMQEDIKNTNYKTPFVLSFVYLYQASCGGYFNATSEILISDMTQSEYDDFWDGVIEQNALSCMNKPSTPTNYFAKNKIADEK